MAMGSGLQRHLSFRENILACDGILTSSHVGPGENIFITHSNITLPKVGWLQKYVSRHDKMSWQRVLLRRF